MNKYNKSLSNNINSDELTVRNVGLFYLFFYNKLEVN